MMATHPPECNCPDTGTSMHPFASAPRLVVAGLSGDAGKTLVSLGLLLLGRQSGIRVKAFKKGPDYIDAAWLSWASGSPARNLDTFLMGPEKTTQHFLANSISGGLNLIEGNRGLFDGVDVCGTHSTAELAKLLKAPVLLVVSGTKVTHTVAALVSGCINLDPEVQIGGVVLNHVSGHRHEAVLRDSIESTCGVPVLGVLPNVDTSVSLPSRHLGLVTPQEHADVDLLRQNILTAVQDRLDAGRILKLAESVPPLPGWFKESEHTKDGCGLKIAYLKDSAFTFYYPENLEALESAGVQLWPVSALETSALPEGLDALYIGGGFPETHAGALSENGSFLASIRDHALKGLPVYAECGGLMLLSRAIRWKGRRLPMAGVLPLEVEMCTKPQGHGYVELLVDHLNPYYRPGTRIRGHEFHYSRIVAADSCMPTACAVERGTGCSKKRDGLFMKNVWASYTHIHATSTREWAQGVIAQARLSQRRRTNLRMSKHLLCSAPTARVSFP
jgi:cobyrinic acid a,c-diamide synthase